MKYATFLGTTTALASAVLLAACGGGGGASSGGTGQMRISLTDAPACGYDEVWVTVKEVRVHRSATAADPAVDPTGWEGIVLTRPVKLDLLTLTNGAFEVLGTDELPAGRYSQVRLVLDENSNAPGRDPYANAVRPTGGALVPLDTPSAQQTGLKIPLQNVEVPEGQVLDLMIDFQVCKSVVKRGNSGRYNLKPVLTAFPWFDTAYQRVEGWIDPQLAAADTLPTTTISLQQDGVPIRSTPPLNALPTQGKFVLGPAPEGVYDVVVSADGRATAVITGVPVSATSVTRLNTADSRIFPGTSEMRDVGGTVTNQADGSVPVGAFVAATQSIGAGMVERVGRPATADTGVYGFALPASAPQVATAASAAAAAASAVPVPLASVAASGVPYTLTATATGKAPVVKTLDVSAGPGPFGVDFVFGP